jgi:hypothetical protein
MINSSIYRLSIHDLSQTINNIPGQQFEQLNSINKGFKYILNQTNQKLQLNKKIKELIEFTTINDEDSDINEILHKNIKNTNKDDKGKDKIDKDDKDKIDKDDKGKDKIDKDDKDRLIIQKQNIYTHEKQIDNKYIVYYPKDYISLNAISNKQCMTNSTAIIQSIINRSINYSKLDSKGNMPLYYAVQSGNYILIDLIMEKNKLKKNNILSFLDKNNKSIISYAYEILEITEKTDLNYAMLNTSYINNLLLLADINNNIPKNYPSLYKILLGHTNI